jgi:O-antigen/teichoic acid export membrane protein
MNFVAELKDENDFIRDIYKRFRKNDFSGDTGQVIKNSSYQLAQNTIYKFGSLLFTIIIARLLLPERMGLYGLALSTIILFASFSDLGLSQAVMTFVSKQLAKHNLQKARAYLNKLIQWKIYLLLIIAILLIPSSYLIATFIYSDKPIFFALLAGLLYIPIVSLINFAECFYKAANNFKTPLVKEILFQILRFTIVPLITLLSINKDLSSQKIVFIILLSLVFTYFISLFYLLVKSKRSLSFSVSNKSPLTETENIELKKFIIPLSATAMAGMFFGYIDTIMLGYYVSSSYIAYYGAAFSLVGGVTAIIGFMSMSLMPIFARKDGKALDRIFKKTKYLTLLISMAAGIFTYFVAEQVVRIIYGIEYIQASNVLRMFSLLIILLPVLAIYISYFTSQKRTKELALLTLISSLLNVVFNFVGITHGLTFGPMGAVYGACIATILSRVLYLVGLIFLKK